MRHSILNVLYSCEQVEVAKENRHDKNKKLLWIAVAVTAVLDCAVYVSRAAKAPDKVASSTAQTTPLKPPAKGPINVAFVISEGADVMDIAGPWEVFSDAMLTSKGKPWHETDGRTT